MYTGLTSLLALLAIKGYMLLSGYFKNGNTFPQPLSEDEEAECIDGLREGDQEARARLIEHNLRLVAHIVKKFSNSSEDTEDLISIGTIGLIKGISTFKPERGTRLATYAARCIENQILMHFRSLKKRRNEMYLQDPIGIDSEGNELTLMDTLGSDPDIVDDAVGLKMEERRLRRNMEKLDPKEKKVVELRYGLDNGIKRTQKEIAWALGISRSYVSRIEKRAVHKLSQHMTADDPL